MDRREIMKRGLRADIRWGLGNVGCHGTYSDGRVDGSASEPTPEPGEGFYVVTLDPATGDISVAPGDASQSES